MATATEPIALSLDDYGNPVVGTGEEAATLLTGSAGADLDVFFVLVSGYMVFFMQCGFAMLSSGSVRHKNSRNIMLKNLLDACFGAICFYFIGYGFAYGGDAGNAFIGWGPFVLRNEARDAWFGWFFQFAFAATAATIVSGAVAERCKFEAYILYAVFLTSWVYPVVVHWIWSVSGWASAFNDNPDKLLFDTGVVDFAGCGVVHMVGGFAALAGAAVLGPRIGRFVDGKAQDIPGHNASLAILGVFILWFGWYGFNPGSALAILGAGEIAALAAINTTLSAAGGTVGALITLFALSGGDYDLIGASNGTLAGLVGITSACSVVEPWGALIIGLISGVFYVGCSKFILHVLKIDDPLDAIAVHGFVGFWGLIAASLFAAKVPTATSYGLDQYGLFMGGGWRLFAAAIVTGLAVIAWVLGHMFPFFLALKFAGLFRVSEEHELEGCDASHGMGSDGVEGPLAKIDALEAEVRKLAAGKPTGSAPAAVSAPAPSKPVVWAAPPQA